MEQEKKPRVFKIAEGAVREIEKLAAILSGRCDADDEEDPEDVIKRVILNLRRRNEELNDEYRTRNKALVAKIVREKRRARQLRRFGDFNGCVYLRRKFLQPERLTSVNPTLFDVPSGPFVYDLVPDEEYYVPCRVCGLGEPEEDGTRYVQVRLINKDRTGTPWRTYVQVESLYFQPEDGLKIVDFCDELHNDFVNSITWSHLRNVDEERAKERERRRAWQARMKQKEQEQ